MKVCVFLKYYYTFHLIGIKLWEIVGILLGRLLWLKKISKSEGQHFGSQVMYGAQSSPVAILAHGIYWLIERPAQGIKGLIQWSHPPAPWRLGDPVRPGLPMSTMNPINSAIHLDTLCYNNHCLNRCGCFRWPGNPWVLLMSTMAPIFFLKSTLHLMAKPNQRSHQVPLR